MSTTLKALHLSNQNIDASFLENFSLKKDYLNISNDLSIIELLIDQGDTDPHGTCLSDDISIFDTKMDRQRVQIIITKLGIYLFGKMTKFETEKMKKQLKSQIFTNWKLIHHYKLKNLEQVIISSENYTLAAFVFNDQDEFLIDSCRKTEIIAYVAHMMKFQADNKFKIMFLNSFNIPQPDLTTPKTIKEKKIKLGGKGGMPSISQSFIGFENSFGNKKAKKNQQSLSVVNRSRSIIFQEIIRNSKLTGYLKLKQIIKRVIFKDQVVFSEFFFVLTNLGLLYFKNQAVSLFYYICVLQRQFKYKKNVFLLKIGFKTRRIYTYYRRYYFKS